MNSTVRFIFNENFVKKEIYESHKQYMKFTKKPLILLKPASLKKNKKRKRRRAAKSTKSKQSRNLMFSGTRKDYSIKFNY